MQIKAYQHGVAAILRRVNRNAEWCAGHKEFALPHGRKEDPSFEMVEFRGTVARILSGSADSVATIPTSEPTSAEGAFGRPTLRRPSTGDLVKGLQKKLQLTPDGEFGPTTEAAVRAFQRKAGLVPDGIVGPKTWKSLDQST